MGRAKCSPGTLTTNWHVNTRRRAVADIYSVGYAKCRNPKMREENMTHESPKRLRPTHRYSAETMRQGILQNPGLTPKELAAVIGCTPGAVRSYAYRHGLKFRKVTTEVGPRKKRARKPKPYIVSPKQEAPEKQEVSRPQIHAGMMGSGRAYVSTYTRIL